jgi:multidrug transporter EmrE-like cation transporter
MLGWNRLAHTAARYLNVFHSLPIYLASAVLTAIGLIGLRHQLLEQDIFNVSIALLPSALTYVAGIGVWLIVAERNPLSVAYPMGIGFSMIAAVGGGALFLDETITISKALGILFILAALFIIGRSSR